MQKTAEKHKHVVGHEVPVVLTEELLAKYKEEAYSWLPDTKTSSESEEMIKNMMLECGLDLPTSDYGNEMFVRGFTLARAIAYKRNNGVPPIPFPVSFSTIDVGGICFHEGEFLLLLGRKPDQTCFQFPGGFRDPKETNAQAASREFEEEASLKLPYKRFEYVDQLYIDDIRYRNSCHKITTTLFIINMTYAEITTAVAGDDLEEVKIFKINELIQDNSIIRDIHHRLFEMLWQYLLAVPEQASYITAK